MNSRRHTLALAGILALGLGLRLWGLGGEGLWIDEGHSVMVSRLGLGELFKACAMDNHVPLYFLLVKGWSALFGESEFALRVPAVIFGMLSIWATYLAGAMLFGREAGLVSSLLTALSVLLVHHSQEARMYGLLGLLALASMYFFIGLLRGRGRAFDVGYVLSTGLLMYTHAYWAATILAQNVVYATELVLWREQRRVSVKRWILLQVAVAALYAPWVPILRRQVAQVASEIPLLNVGGSMWLMAGYTLAVFSGYWMPLLAVMLPLAALSVLRWHKSEGALEWRNLVGSVEGHRWTIYVAELRSNYLAVVWLAAPMVLPVIMSLFLTPIYAWKAAIGSAPALYVLAANGLTKLRSKWWRRALLVVVVGLCVPPLWRYYVVVGKERWREVAQYIETHASPGDLVLFNSGICRTWIYDYYATRTDLVLGSLPEPPTEGAFSPAAISARTVDDETLKQLGPLVEGRARVWLILSHYGQGAFRIAEELSKAFHKAEFREYRPPSQGGYTSVIYLYRFERKPGHVE